MGDDTTFRRADLKRLLRPGEQSIDRTTPMLPGYNENIRHEIVRPAKPAPFHAAYFEDYVSQKLGAPDEIKRTTTGVTFVYPTFEIGASEHICFFHIGSFHYSCGNSRAYNSVTDVVEGLRSIRQQVPRWEGKLDRRLVAFEKSLAARWPRDDWHFERGRLQAFPSDARKLPATVIVFRSRRFSIGTSTVEATFDVFPNLYCKIEHDGMKDWWGGIYGERFSAGFRRGKLRDVVSSCKHWLEVYKQQAAAL
jgi:hypothetical protein